MRSVRAALAAASLLLPVWSWAERPDARVITESEYLATAGESSAQRALREEVGLARADALAARTLRNPRFAASREAPANATEQLDLTLAWEPPRPGRRRLAVAAADAGITAAQSRFDVGRIGLRLSMREAFARWAVAADRTSMQAAFADRLESLARAQRQRAEAGEIAGLDARRMTLAAAEAKAELARVESELLNARAAALAWRPDLAPDVRPVLPEVQMAPVLAPSHPDVSALEAELVAARLERDVAERVLDLPELVGGWQRQRFDGLTAEGPILGLEWPLPLLDRGRAERARADARIDALEARLKHARQSLDARRRGALEAYELLRTAALEAATLEQSAEPMVTAATASFRLGEADVTDLLETLRAASGARLQALELRSAALDAHRELERLAGVLKEESDDALQP